MASVHALIQFGEIAATYADGFYNRLSLKQRNAILWDMEGMSKRSLFHKAIHDSAYVGLLFEGPYVMGIAWVNPVARLSRCANIHFSFATNDFAFVEAAGKQCLAGLTRYYDCLIGFMPAMYFGARRVAALLGFREVARLPKACYLARHKRYCDGTIVTKQLED